MEPNPLVDRGRALEEGYFRRLEESRRARLASDRQRRESRQALSEKLGVDEELVLEKLVELDIGPETTAAFEVLPLVEVAWADGAVDDEERQRVLEAAVEMGLELGGPAHEQLEVWLAERPEKELFAAWYAVTFERLGVRDAARRADRLLESARGVARASGGFLGVGGVSRSEKAALNDISRALEAAVDPERAPPGRGTLPA